MDLPVYVRRADKSPPASAPTGGALSSEEHDGNLDETERALTELDAETIKVADASSLTLEKPVLVAADAFVVVNSEYDEEDPDDRPFVLHNWDDFLAAVLGEIPDGPGTAAEIRDALETLTGADRLDATALSGLGDAVVAELEARTGADRLDYEALKNTPTFVAGDPVAITHDGAGEDPVVGDTLTATPVGGWTGQYQWRRGGTPIGGATAATHVAVEDDEEEVIDLIFGDPDGLHFIAPGFTVALPAATVPDAFETGDWTATAGVEEIAVDIDALPADGGSAITALQYRIDGGTPATFSGTGLGVRDITGLTGGVEVDVEIRAVNAVGNGAWSDVKSRTPSAASGGLAIVQEPDPSWVSGDDEFQQTVTAITSGNGAGVLVNSQTSAGAPALSDSAGGDDDDWGTPLHTYNDANGWTTRVYERANITSGLTWVRATFVGNTDGFIAVVEVSGAGSAISLDDSGGAAQGTSTDWDFPVTSTVDGTLFMGAANLTNGSPPTGVSPIDATSLAGDYAFYARGILATAGAQTGEVNLVDGRNGGKAWAVLRAGA
jgi:hypothetical protein